MTTRVRDYSKTKMYEVVPINGEPDERYIGHTTKKYLCQRWATHKGQYNYWKKTGVGYCYSFILFEKYGIDNCRISLIENYPCNSHDEASAREGNFIRTMECCNKRIEGRTYQEWFIDNKDKVKEYKKEYRQENKQKIKEYRQKNKEKLNQYQREYRQQQKDKINQHQREYRAKLKADKLLNSISA